MTLAMTQRSPRREEGMGLQDVWVQGEAIAGVHRLRVPPGSTARELKNLASLLRTQETGEGLMLFLQGATVPLEDDDVLPIHPERTLEAHLHRCREVKVRVREKEMVREICVSPAATFASILVQVAPLSADPYLVISGTETQVEPQRHVGGFVFYPFGELVLDLRETVLDRSPQIRRNRSSGKVR